MVRNIPELDSIQAIEGSVESFGERNLKKKKHCGTSAHGFTEPLKLYLQLLFVEMKVVRTCSETKYVSVPV